MSKGFTLWFTGMSGAGKSTLANLVAEELRARGHRVEVLDGDEIRTHLSKGLGFSKEDRDTNIRRIGYVAKLLSRNGVVAISAAISPYRDVRDELRREFGVASMLSERLLGPLLLATARREGRRLARGITYEPKAIIERTNWVGNADSAVLPASAGSVLRRDYAVTGMSSMRPPTIATSGSVPFPQLRVRDTEQF